MSADPTTHELDSMSTNELGLQGDAKEDGRKARSTRFRTLLVFVFLESLWLGWGFYVGLKAPSIANREFHFFGKEVTWSHISQSVLNFLAGLYQTFALVFPGALVCEAFASEWVYLLKSNLSLAEAKQRIFLLKCASPVFRIALVASLLLVPL